MSDQVFELDNYRGPLDLLLQLIRQQELEILDVDLSRLCDQYLAELERMKTLDIDLAGEFLVLASTLILIKSRTLLPCEEEVDLEEELDPADELIQQLLEYRKYKSLSLEMGRRADERLRWHARGAREVPPDEANELAEIGVWDLVGSFARLMEEVGLQREFHTLRSEKPLRAYLEQVLDVLLARGQATLRELLAAADGGQGLFGVFLALLELVRSQQVVARQEEPGADVVLALRADRDPSALSFLYEDAEGSPPGAPKEGARGPAPTEGASGGARLGLSSAGQ